MAVISVRLNAEEEKMVSFLSTEFEKDKSTLIKLSLKEMYEDFIDKKIIDDYEIKENKNKTSFVSAEEILKQI
jgi:predicted lipid-binding transport protein (Tim44 family)